MGMLDDAIREHLELKRRHGAAEEEVAQLEAEVLTPPPEPEPAPLADPEPTPLADAEPALQTAEALAPAAAEPAAEAPPPAPAPAEPIAPDPIAPDPIAPADPELAELVEEAPAVHAVVPSFTDDEPWLDDAEEPPRGRTTEFTADELAEAAGDAETSEYVAPDEEPGEDVLEETPDFLQETPEHDRLWFEQKPPRDFDFDK